MLLNTRWTNWTFNENGELHSWNEDTLEEIIVNYSLEHPQGESQLTLINNGEPLVTFSYVRNTGMLINPQLGVIQGQLPYGVTYSEADLYD
jgi:hypothetical protein